MEYSKLFNTEAQHIDYINSSLYKEPYISYIQNTKSMHYNKVTTETNTPDFLRFTAVSNIATICIGTERNLSNINNSIKYSFTGEDNTWEDMSTDPIALSKFETIYLIGVNTEGFMDPGEYNTMSGFSSITDDYDDSYLTCKPFFKMTGRFIVNGNIMSIVDCTQEDGYDIPESVPVIKDNNDDELGYFRAFFANTPNILTAPKLPITLLRPYCYAYMFTGCTGLTETPELPATDLNQGCYEGMFLKCSNIKTVHELPATTFIGSKNPFYDVYIGMFSQCVSLKTAMHILPSTSLSDGCYYGMFYGCTSLSEIPILPATEIQIGSYQYMFQNCTNLKSVTNNDMPIAISVQTCGCAHMFKNCKLLETAPAQLMTADADIYDHSHNSMFEDCTNLVSAPALPAESISEYSYANMFRNCTSLVDAPPELPATGIGKYCYSSMFYNCTSLTESPIIGSLTESPAFPTNTKDENYRCSDNMFEGCINLSTVYCYFPRNFANAVSSGSVGQTIYLYTFRWLNNVAETGSFYCRVNATQTFTSEVAQSTNVPPGRYTPKRGPSGIPASWTVLEQRT